ncbi:uncharacterized protein SPPG_02248 [Spizellomyces punctatus DAOM BR117]|uniref:RNA-binding protein VTS1 n=1 Tax=Spizellomyces punctatus (strain DAOM BR117) TaxID=645134 RepID=A0A0L0HQG2_SPIPD|nr:uncharacterized protein SPPG_02248 [Spizellomyces punctatus DAOM BR117]KND03190.1 hypothetical protein SPPG_02248 [Spizellomyces punctatus DAOM BR117]|eukprot:XP_016611229.1 hypothetical protein SPPG_02248 [Spizellomyces punctatus DAOM BR117]
MSAAPALSDVQQAQRSSAAERPMSDFHPGMARPVSANIGTLQKGNAQRPSSEVLNSHYKSPEAEAIDRWFEDLSYYERTLEQMARAKLDDNFREELKHIEQWFNVLSDPERTTALYSLLQHATQVQIRFFITVLQQMAQKDPASGAAPPDPSGKPPVPPEATRLAPKKVASMPPRVASPAPGTAVAAAAVAAAAAIGVTLPTELDAEDDRYLSVIPLAGNGPRSTRRLYDRHSAPNADEQYAQLLGDLHSREGVAHGVEYPEDYAYQRNSYQSLRQAGSQPGSARNSAQMSPLLRPNTPVDDAIASADWSLNPATGQKSTVPVVERPPSGALGNGTFTPHLGLPHDDLAPSMAGLSLQPPRSPYARPVSPRPVSPIILSPPTPAGVHAPHAGHPSPGWGYVDVRSSTPSAYAHSDYSDTHSHDGLREDQEGYHDRLRPGPHKEKGKIPESVDLEALNDIPSWLRSLRLHKYTPTFEHMQWKDMIKLDEEALIEKGVSALGARRKMLKVFELVRKELDAKGVPY